ncbi:MAG: LEA type 2 family protein [Chitinophagales bacterium]|nr:LEA type 2 family protein [Chitinophagales bacterium]
MKNYFYAFTMTFLVSCSSIIPLEYRGFQQIKVSESQAEPVINIDMHLHNPNPVGVKIKEMQMHIKVQNQEVGMAGIEDALRIKRRSDFTLPITVQTTYAQLGDVLKNAAGTFLSGKEIPVEVNGTITIKKFIFFKRTYDFIFTENVNASELLK